MKNLTNNTMYVVQDPHAFSYLFKVTLAILFSSIFSLHSSTYLQINLFQYLQF